MVAAGGLFILVCSTLPLPKPMFIHFRLPAQRIVLHRQQLNTVKKWMTTERKEQTQRIIKYYTIFSFSLFFCEGRRGGDGGSRGALSTFTIDPIVLSSLLYGIPFTDLMRLVWCWLHNFMQKRKRHQQTRQDKKSLNTFNALNMLNETDSFYLQLFF